MSEHAVDDAANRPTNENGTSGRDQSRKGRALKAILVILVLALSAEGLTWLQQYAKAGFLPTYKPRHLIDFYRFYRVNPEYRSPTVRVNAAGFRNDEEITREKPANVVRIVMMGGSTVWGEDAGQPFSGTIDNRDTIAAQLETALNDRAGNRHSPTKVQVINAGVVGYMLFQEVAYFADYVADFKPDLVIAMDGHNDLDALQLGVPLYRHRNDALFDHEMNDPSALDVFRQILRYAEQKSLFVRKVSSKASEWMSQIALSAPWRRRFETPPEEPRIQSWLRAYESTARRFDAAARIADASVLFVVQLEVVGERIKPLTVDEVRMREHWAYYRWLHTTMRDRLIGRLREASARYGLWFEDVTDAFRDERQQAYLDYTHLTRRGARVMAERLADLIEAEVFCDGPSLRSPRCRQASVANADTPRTPESTPPDRARAIGALPVQPTPSGRASRG